MFGPTEWNIYSRAGRMHSRVFAVAVAESVCVIGVHGSAFPVDLTTQVVAVLVGRGQVVKASRFYGREAEVLVIPECIPWG